MITVDVTNQQWIGTHDRNIEYSNQPVECDGD